MNVQPTVPAARDPLLFTPGPLTTSLSVKLAMLHDAGSWHWDFNQLVLWIRDRLLTLAGVTREQGWECVPMQGTGTFGVEAIFATCVPPHGKVVVLSNGAYGERMVQMLQAQKIDHLVLRTPENTPNDPDALDQLLSRDAAITHVAMVHCETTTGLLNPLVQVGEITRRHGRIFIVDAISSFGAIPIDFSRSGIDFLVSTANKCIEGVPGFSFIFCRRILLLGCEGWARSLSLDLLSQWKGFEKNGQFRYTPPTHAILAFAQALRELELEGGIPARGARYQRNQEILVEGMRKIGLRPFLNPAGQSCIITSFHFPTDRRFTFPDFYRRLAEHGFIIYPGKISEADTFRIGSIGRIFEADIRALLAAIAETLDAMEIDRGKSL